jgi:hypothetical protein
MKLGNLKFERNSLGQVKIAKHWGQSDGEEFVQYLSPEEWDKLVKHLTVPVVAKATMAEPEVKEKTVITTKRAR